MVSKSNEGAAQPIIEHAIVDGVALIICEMVGLIKECELPEQLANIIDIELLD